MDDLEPEFKRVAKLIYAGKMQPGDIDPAMVKKMARQLMKAVTEGLGGTTSVPESFTRHIEQNILVFSGFKNNAQLTEARNLLLASDGSYRNFHDWFEDIKAINGTYNEVYANAEYSNALGSAQNIASYHDYVANGIDVLKFQTVGDSRVRPDHAILNGIVCKITDPLFDKYSTPLDWGCRCEWVPAIGGEITGFTKDELPHVPPMFSTNMAKTGIIFPDHHPYFKVSQGIAEKVIDQVVAILPKYDQPEFTPAGLPAYEKKLGVKVDRSFFNYLNKETPLTHKSGGAHYAPDENQVNIPFDSRRKQSKWYAEAVVYHEYGHAADWQNNFKKAKPLLDLMATSRKKYRDDFSKLSFNLIQRIEKTTIGDTREKIAAVADTIKSLNRNYGFGHSGSYFKQPGKSEAEFLAHTFENRFAGNDIFKELMPELYEDMRNLADELLKLKQ